MNDIVWLTLGLITALGTIIYGYLLVRSGKRVNEHYLAWIEQIYKRDTFYLYIAAVVLAGFSWYVALKAGRFFKYVLLMALAGVGIGIIWGLGQL